MSVQVMFYYFAFLFVSSGSFCLSKVLVLFIPSFIFCCLYPLSINLLRNISQLSWNSLFVEQMWIRRKACVNGMLRIKKTQGVPMFRAWFPVYPIVFYKRQHLRNLYLYQKIKVKFYRQTSLISCLNFISWSLVLVHIRKNALWIADKIQTLFQ